MPYVVDSATREAILLSHSGNLEALVDGRPLWMPAFNYDFCRSGAWDDRATPSQVGPISEHFRVTSDWRTLVPVFSMVGIGAPPPSASAPPPLSIDPFDTKSAFHTLLELDGTILWYGAPISSSTLIHYVERLSGGPLYRYDKRFRGTITTDGAIYETELVYHVRPQSLGIEYSWDQLREQAMAAGVIRQLDHQGRILWASVRALTDLWTETMLRDPFALLTSESRAQVEPHVMKLGRRLEVGDFE
jgi:aminoglycoside N3'-acetyltransferase